MTAMRLVGAQTEAITSGRRDQERLAGQKMKVAAFSFEKKSFWSFKGLCRELGLKLLSTYAGRGCTWWE